jgi:dihydrofolate reductase
MSQVYTGASMSLDGYIAGPNESGFEHLFKWYGNGDVEVPTRKPEMTLRMTQPSADRWRSVVDMTGALVVGRKLFDSTSGWGGEHPMGLPVVVLTHEPPGDWPPRTPFTFVTDGIESAIATARELAAGKVVGVNGARSPASAWTPACSTRSGSTWFRSCSAAARRSSSTSRSRRSSSRGRCRSPRDAT